MSTNRKLVFANGEIYHIFNRGVEKRPTFTNKRDLKRAVETLSYYRFANASLRFSFFIRLEKEQQALALKRLSISKRVDILAYCLMPNHFHFLLRQTRGNGISKFAADFTNSYTKYFNTKYKRVGPLFQGLFKAVHIDTDEQLLHVSRYIHLNPVSSFLITAEELEKYEWSSYPKYINKENPDFIDKNTVLDFFKDADSYKKFVLDQADYARTLEEIKHLALEK